MAAAVPTPALRKVFDDRISLLASDVETLFETELECRVAEMRRTIRRELAEDLNQALRRLRQVSGFASVAAAVVDSATRLCNCAAVFSVSKGIVKGEYARGLAAPALERFRALQFPARDAAAFAGVLDTQDPVITIGTARELSPAVVETLAREAGGRVALFPMVVRETVVGLLYASAIEEMAPLELLSQAAAMRLEARDSAPPDLVAIQAAPGRIPESWSELPAHDRELHLRAQRFARVQVAGMKLYAAEAVKAGRAGRDLYQALQKYIDSGREVFRQSFLSARPTMVDYFHLELVRSLANDDAALLGQSYPGPLV